MFPKHVLIPLNEKRVELSKIKGSHLAESENIISKQHISGSCVYLCFLSILYFSGSQRLQGQDGEKPLALVSMH